MEITEPVRTLILNYMIYGNNIGATDVFDAVEILSNIGGEDIINVIMESREILRPIATNEIPQFSNEKDVYGVLRVLIDSGLDDMTYEQIGAYLCPADAKFFARRKYGENHYKFTCQLGLAVKEHPFSATEIGVAYYLLDSNEKRQALMNRLIFSVPFVQHAIIKAACGQYSMPDYLGNYLSPSTVARRRSNMRKIMSWAHSITEGKHKSLFDNIVWY